MVGVPHPDFGEGVVAVVVAAPSEEAAMIAAARAPARRLQGAQAGVFVDELPRNAMGKVQKNLLRELLGTDAAAP